MDETMSDLYHRDFHAWANEQVSLPRMGKLSDADVGNIAEEIATLGRHEKRELAGRLTVLLHRLLEWRFQPQRRSRSWEVSIANTRDELVDHLADNPSLKALLPEAMTTAYRRARRTASNKTGLLESALPDECPWTFDQAMQDQPA